MENKLAVDNRLIRRTASALRFWLLINRPTPFCLYKLVFGQVLHEKGLHGQIGVRHRSAAANEERPSSRGQTVNKSRINVLMFLHQFTDSLEDKGDSFPLGETICRRSFLPSPALPRRPAVRRPSLTYQCYVRFIHSTY